MHMRNTTVYIASSDQCIAREAQELISTALDYHVSICLSGEELLDFHIDSQPGCVVADMHLSDMTGLELHQSLSQNGATLPVILISHDDDVPTAIRAIKQGAFDVLHVPFSNIELLNAIRSAVSKDKELSQLSQLHEQVQTRMASLTPREQQVLQLVTLGYLNKQIAMQLKITEGTVEYHRSKVMKKMQAKSLAGLICMVVAPASSRAMSIATLRETGIRDFLDMDATINCQAI